MAEQVFDLDVMRPEPVLVKLLGVQLDVSFVPAGVAMILERKQGELAEMKLDADGNERPAEELAADLEYIRNQLHTMCDMVELLAQGRAPELTRERMLNECSMQQLDSLITLTFRHMYGPRTRAIIDEEMAKGSNGANGDKKPENPTGAIGSGPTKSRRSPKPTTGRRTTVSKG